MAKYKSKFSGMYNGAQQFMNIERQLNKIERDLLSIVNKFYMPESQLSAIHNQLKVCQQNSSNTKTHVKAIASAIKAITELYEQAERDAGNRIEQADMLSIRESIAGLSQRLQLAAVTLGMNPANLFSIDPVNLATGNYVYENTFLHIPYDMPLSFRLFFNTLAETRGAIGNGWLHNFEISLSENETGLYEVILDDGSVKYFSVKENGLIEPLSGTTAKLIKTTDGFKYSDTEGIDYLFNTDGSLMSQHDRVGNYLEMTCAENNRLEKVQNDRGDYLAFHYNSNGKLEAVLDHDGRSISLRYDDNGLLIAVCDVMGYETIYGYDDEYRLIKITNPNGVACLVNEYDSDSRTIKQFFPDDGMVSYEYVDSERQVVLTEQNGNSIIYEHDEQMRNVRSVYSDGQELFEYNSNNQRTAYTDKLGRRSEYSYNQHGHMTRFTNALGESVDIRYTEDSQPEAISVNGLVLYESVYNDLGKEISATDALGRTNRFEYDDIGNLIAMTMPDGSLIRLTYDEKGNVSSVTNPSGGCSKYSYDQLHRVICSVDGNGNKTEFTYNAKNDIISVTNAEGSICRYEYDNCGNVVKIIEFNGAVMEVDYNSINKPCRITNANGGITLIEYDQMWNVSKVTEPNGGITSYIYNQLNRLESVTMPDGATTYLKHDNCGNLIERIRPDGAVFKIVYDALNRPVEVMGPDGDVTKACFTDLGDVASIKLSDGRQRLFEHDAMGQMISEISFGGHKTNYDYNELGLVTRIYDDRGDIKKYAYYPGGLLKAETNADGSSLAYTYDLEGNLISAVNQDGNTWSYTYDSLSRIKSITNDLGMEEHYKYDAGGNITEVTDGVGAVTHYQYSLTGKLISVVDALGNETSYEYDAMDHLTLITQFDGLKAAYQINTLNDRQKIRSVNLHRDLMSNVRKIVDASGNTTEYTYDCQGNITSVLDADGYLTKYEYCADGRTKNIIYVDGRSVKMSYNSLKQLSEVEDWLGITRIQSDEEGRPLQVVNHNQETVSYEWSARGELLKLCYPDGNAVQYQYDNASRLLRMSGPAGIVEYDYQANGLLKSKRQNGVCSSDYQYDIGGRLSSLIHKSSDEKVFDQFLYGYNKNGLKAAIEKQRPDMQDSGKFGYEYDMVGNLLAVTKNGIIQQAFGYDAFGNRVEHQSGEVKYSYSYNILNQLTAISGADIRRDFSYDKRGNLIEETKNGMLHSSMQFDASNRLVQVTSKDKKAFYSYNGFGGRVGRRVMDFNGLILEDEFYCLDLTRDYNNLLQQRSNIGSSNFYYDDALLSSAGALGTASFLLDELQTPIRMCRQNGHSEGYAYDAFGLPCSGQTQPLFGFSGYRPDNVSGLYFAQRREYAADYGRFISRDPVDGTLTRPKTLNRYAYCENDPINRVDYTGLIAIWLAGGIVGSVKNVTGRLGGDIIKSVVAGKTSFTSWQEYVGTAAGGFAEGSTFVLTPGDLATRRTVAGATGGAVEAFTTGGLQMLTDKGNPNAPPNFGDLMRNTVVSGATGGSFSFITQKVVSVKGITAGQGSWDATFRRLTTGAKDIFGLGGHWANMSVSTMFKGMASQGMKAFLLGANKEIKKQVDNFCNSLVEKIGKNIRDIIKNSTRHVLPGATPILLYEKRKEAMCPLGA